MDMEKDKIVFKGSHPDSLYRVPTNSGVGVNKLTRALLVLRWPAALVTVCIALGVFVYFLMPDNLDSTARGNGTYWQPVPAGIGLHGPEAQSNDIEANAETTNKIGTKTSEIDFYDAQNDKNADTISVTETITEINPIRKLPIPPVFPTHLSPEVQYGNEKADSEKRMPKVLEDITLDDSTLKPQITQKPEKPLAIYFKNINDAITATTETISRAETINDVTNYIQKQSDINDEVPVKTQFTGYNEYIVPPPKEYSVPTPNEYVPESKDYVVQTSEEYVHTDRDIPKDSINPELPHLKNQKSAPSPSIDDVYFTSSHSKLFGISIEDAQRLKSTTQSALYNTRVSPTLPTWRDRDDSTTKKYPVNIYSEVQCRSTRLPLCRGVLPYDLAGAVANVGEVDISSLIPQIDYLVATNCSDRVRHFVCALLEPECSPPPYPQKLPCYNLCKAIVDSCDGHIPRELSSVFNCKQYSRQNCVAAKTPCYLREFTCGDGSCIPRDWLCDGRNDCPAGEDEQKCFQCEETDFKCPSGGCILKRWQCDGYKDCPDGEDESETICGPRHVQAPDDHNAEPGEESAGSAPAPVVRRPNRVPPGQRKQNSARQGENDSSKELLVTSDSNNGLTIRNFTPSPSRLSPYNHSSIRTSSPNNIKFRKEGSVERTQGVNRTSNNVKDILDNDSVEDVNVGDLGFFDEFEKDGKTDQKQSQRQKSKTFGVPAPSSNARKQATQAEDTSDGPPVHRLSQSKTSFNKVIDGAALLRKATAADAAEAARVTEEAEGENGGTPETNSTYLDKEDFPTGDYNAGKQGWGRAHTSPCPSGELRCVDGLCITLAQLCDGTIDCSDHADEDNCYT